MSHLVLHPQCLVQRLEYRSEAKMLVECMNGCALQPLFYIGTPVLISFLISIKYPRVVKQDQTVHQSSSDSDSGNMRFKRIRNHCYPSWILKILKRQKQWEIICSNSFIFQKRKHDMVCCTASNTTFTVNYNSERSLCITWNTADQGSRDTVTMQYISHLSWTTSCLGQHKFKSFLGSCFV